jgi:hypothetical protein
MILTFQCVCPFAWLQYEPSFGEGLLRVAREKINFQTRLIVRKWGCQDGSNQIFGNQLHTPQLIGIKEATVLISFHGNMLC